jgi:ectoine hydroxylase
MSTTASDPYFSRLDGVAESTRRLDPVVWDGGEGPLTRDELDRYHRNGFLLFPELIGPERVAAMWEEAQRLAVRGRERGEEGMIIEPESDVVRSVFLLHRHSRLFAEMIASPELVGRARQLLGGDVYVHQSRVNFKPGFLGKEFYWHSDFETWHMEDGMPRMRAVSASIMLTENNEFNGPLMLIPGSHHTYFRCPGKTPDDHHTMSLRKQEYGVPTRDQLTDLVRERGIRSAKGPAGTVLFFECNVMLGSSGNITPYQRNGMFLVFNSLENRLQEPFAGIPPRPGFLAERNPVPVP